MDALAPGRSVFDQAFLTSAALSDLNPKCKNLHHKRHFASVLTASDTVDLDS